MIRKLTVVMFIGFALLFSYIQVVSESNSYQTQEEINYEN